MIKIKGDTILDSPNLRTVSQRGQWNFITIFGASLTLMLFTAFMFGIYLDKVDFQLFVQTFSPIVTFVLGYIAKFLHSD